MCTTHNKILRIISSEWLICTCSHADILFWEFDDKNIDAVSFNKEYYIYNIYV